MVSNNVIENFEGRNLQFNKRTLIPKLNVTKNDLVEILRVSYTLFAVQACHSAVLDGLDPLLSFSLYACPKQCAVKELSNIRQFSQKKISGAIIQTWGSWVRKQACYPLYYAEGAILC